MAKSKYARHIVTFLFLLILLAHASGAYNIALLDNLERQSYDFRLNSSLSTIKDPRIVIIDIDEISIQELGRWPWSRNILAEMLDNLFDHYKITVVGFDVLFSEKDDSSGLKTLESLAKKELKDNIAYQNIFKKIKPTLEYDQQFATALQNRNVVLGYFFNHEKNPVKQSVIGSLPDPAVLLDDSLANIPFSVATSAGGNLPLFQENASHGGFIDLPIVDADGIIRSIPMVQQFGDVLYESFSLAIVRSLLDFPYVNLIVEEDPANKINLGLEYISFTGFEIPVDERGAALIPYRGTAGSFPYVSAVDIINKTTPLDVMQGSIVLVGTTAAGLLDLRSTPVQNLYPGVEVHANLISGILDNSIKKNPAYISGASIVSLVLIWGIVSIISINRNMTFFAIITLILTISIVAGVYAAWNVANIVLPIASQLSLLLFLAVYQTTFSYFIENKSKRHLAKVFAQYIPHELVDELGNEDDDYAIGGELREMTVMFSDIRGFTSISENMEPKELTQMMNLYFTSMTEAIHLQKGTIDKYIGDAIMAFWGAPIHSEKHAEQALDATLEMIHRLDTLAIEFEKRGWPEISIGIGLNTGPMYVGNLGSEFRMSYTVLGDAVNVGSRVEALTKKYGVPIIVTESTYALCPDYIYRELDRVRVVGKHEPVTIYEPLDKLSNINDETQLELEQYHTALACYRLRKWDEAIVLFKNLILKNDLLIYDEYILRCEFYKQAPPEKCWDGVYTHESK